MTKLTVSIVCICMLMPVWLWSSDRYWIFFRDKGPQESGNFRKLKETVIEKLPEKTIERRLLRGMNAFNEAAISADLPVNTDYIRTVESLGFRIHGHSRWMNGVSGYASQQILEEISGLSFVTSVERVKRWKLKQEKVSPAGPAGFSKPSQLGDTLRYGESTTQIQLHNIQYLHQKGLNGNGILIGIFDTGFNLENPAIRHISSRLVGQYDFIQQDSVTSNQAGDVYNQDSHGTYVLSIMAGFLQDTLIGPAFASDFLLAKTEIVSEEIHAEEDNWAMAAEWAESLGVDIVSTSLGYSEFDSPEFSYNYADMNGETTIITRAANELAIRGVLVASSAGNEGASSWHYITAPADGFKVLTVGAINKKNMVSSFSSRGPTYDGRIKPDVVALGESVYGVISSTGFGFHSGTSASCPLAAGIAAQILQFKRSLDVDGLLNILRESADNSKYPDNDRGWGKIDALRAWELARGGSGNEVLTYRAYPSYPNPFVRQYGYITFPVELNQPARIKIEIFSTLGQKLRDLIYEAQGNFVEVQWDGRDHRGIPVPAGIYLYRISTVYGTAYGKVTVLY
jgi:serine protease AprX